MWEQVDPDVISCNPGPLFRWVMTLSPVSWRLYRSSSQDFYKYLPDVCLMRLLLAPGWWWCWWYLWVIESYCPVPRDVHSPQSWPQHITAPRGSRTIQRGHHILFHFDDEYVFTNRQCQISKVFQPIWQVFRNKEVSIFIWVELESDQLLSIPITSGTRQPPALDSALHSLLFFLTQTAGAGRSRQKLPSAARHGQGELS